MIKATIKKMKMENNTNTPEEEFNKTIRKKTIRAFIIFFLLFHLLNMFGEKFVKEGMLSPFLGMWLAVLVLTPVGIFFTYKAMHDSQLFNKEFYYRSFKQLQDFFSKFKKQSSV